MKAFYSVFLNILILFTTAALSSAQKLELVAIKQFPDHANGLFELSGMVVDQNNNIICIDDNSNKLRKILNPNAIHWQTIVSDSALNFQNTSKSNFESICRFNDIFLISVEEKQGYSISKLTHSALTPLRIDQDDVERKVGLDNSGVEALDYDEQSGYVFFADEGQPSNDGYKNPAIYRISSKKLEPAKLFHQYSGIDDISDLKIFNGHIFVLKRRSCTIEKWRILDEKLIDSVSFKTLLFRDGKQMLFKDYQKFGLAEALVIFEGKLLVGLDNQRKTLDKTFLNFNISNIRIEMNIIDEKIITEPSLSETKSPLIFVFNAPLNFLK